MEAAVGSSALVNVVALCGSLRQSSYHRGLIRAAIQISKDSVKGMSIEFVDISPLPFVNTDLEVAGTFPPVVEAFRERFDKLIATSLLRPSITTLSLVLVSAVPSMRAQFRTGLNTAPLKNAIDWASRPPNAWADKAAAIVSTGGGFGGGVAQYHLRQIGIYLDLHFINKPEFAVKAFEEPAKFDSDGNVVDAATKKKLEEVLVSLRKYALRLQGNSE